METTDEGFNKWYDKNKYISSEYDNIHDMLKHTWKSAIKYRILSQPVISIDQASEHIKSASKTAYLAAGGTEHDFKVWYKKHCTVNVN